MRLLRLLLVLLVASFVASFAAHAQPGGGMDQSPSEKLKRWDSEASSIQERLEAADQLEPGDLDQMRATLEAQRAEIPAVISETESELQPLRRQLEALGPIEDAPPPEAAPEGDPPALPRLTLDLPVEPAQDPDAEPDAEPDAPTAEVAAERERLAARIGDLEARLKLLGQADARATALLSRIAERRREIFTRELLTRGPSPLDPGVLARAFASVTSLAGEIAGETASRIAESRMDPSAIVRVTLATLLVIAAVLLLRGARRALLRRLIWPSGAEAPQHRVMIGISATLVRLLMPALAVSVVLVAALNSGFLGPQGERLLGGLAWTAAVVIGAYGLGGAFYSPQAPALRLSRLSEDDAVRAHHWLMALAAVVGADRALVVGGEAMGLAIPALSLLNFAFLALGGPAMWQFTSRLLAQPPEASEPGGAEDDEEEEPAEGGSDIALAPLAFGALRLIARAVAVVTPVLALMGYFAASRFLFYPVVFSGAVIGVALLLFHAVRDAVDRVMMPADGEEGATPSRIRLIPVFVAFLLICAALPVLALIWGADTTDLANAWRAFSIGFKLGEITIAPLDFFSFLLIFGIGYVLTRIVQGVLRRSVMPVTRLDAGGKAAISAGVFYFGVFLSALVAVSATGLDLSNLALVAGALSVGIGFGLQNIVNNFVSGLILLLERPIKAGDWIQITSGMGYVKQIRVRSTEIETFDRQVLIVPNSELISSSVINWTHTGKQGRLIVPVHVAYGTDPSTVERILLEIAKGHPMLLRRPSPFVLFRRFGPDSLEFEVRGFLRDVNWILNVHSEINFEIARRFTEEGVHIPYPQRDLHLRNTEEVARAIGDALRDDGAAAPGPDTGEPDTAEPDAPKPATPRRRRRRPQEPARDDGDADGPAGGDGGGGGDF